MNKEGIRTRLGVDFTYNGIKSTLRNEAYIGNLLLQKSYRTDHITKQKR